MTTLFTADDLTAYLQRPVSDAQYRIAHDLTLDAIQGEVGGRVADPPQSGVKSVAMGVAGRVLTNPAGLRAATAGAVSETYSDSLAGVTLVDDELKRLKKAVGLSAGANSLNIAPTEYGRRWHVGRSW